jgi:enterochelin esterase-like enzyme
VVATVRTRLPLRLLFGLAAAAFVLVGVVGSYRYLDNFWTYRGFGRPVDPSYVLVHGTRLTIKVRSAALGGRVQPVDIYLPPGYAMHPTRRYPVLYLLHGEPGRPAAFLDTVRMGVVEDELVALRRAQPMILAMPFGSTGTFTDKEWANGIHRHEGWETFVARDVVHAVDTRFRAIPHAWARGIGGLSEGGYGSLNIAFHHPHEFSLIESWSGYERADDIDSIFGHKRALLEHNSPMDTLGKLAPLLRRDHTFIWLYTGNDDTFLAQNEVFARKLTLDHVPHRFAVLRGGHDWSLWRGDAADAFLAASRHLRDVS